MNERIRELAEQAGITVEQYLDRAVSAIEELEMVGYGGLIPAPSSSEHAKAYIKVGADYLCRNDPDYADIDMKIDFKRVQ